MASNFEDKAHMAAEAFLKRKDYELIDLHPDGEAFDFVAKSSDGALVILNDRRALLRHHANVLS